MSKFSRICLDIILGGIVFYFIILPFILGIYIGIVDPIPIY